MTTEEAEAGGPDNPFWTFSLEIYGDPEVEKSCLALQEEFALDVNLLLLCCWLGRHGVLLDPKGLQTLRDQSKAWRQEVVSPLREMRQRLKLAVGAVLPDRSAGLRESIKACELESERILQDLLYDILKNLPGRDGRDADRAGLMRANLVNYARQAGVTDRSGMIPLLEVLVHAADWPEPEEEESDA